MKTAITTTLAMTAFSISACAAIPSRLPAAATAGQIVEFTSGPEGFNTNTFFYIGDQDVVAFDAQFTPELAQAAIKKLRTVTNKPIRWVVVTHPNPDKFNCASSFQAEGAQVIASESTAASLAGVDAYKRNYFVNTAHMFTNDTYPKLAQIDATFKGATDIVLRGGERIQLRELTSAGVSSTQTVAYIPRAKAVMVGDLIHHRVHAWLEGGIVAGKPVVTLNGWRSDLGELASLYPTTTVYGGRGEPGAMLSLVQEQVSYLNIAEGLTGQYAAELKASGAQPDYSELQKRFENAFPGYALGYMISYGAYGLLMSEM